MKRRTWLLGLLAVAVAPATAAAVTPPDEVIRRTVALVFEVLRDPKLQGGDHRPQRTAKIRAIADTVFDWPRMAQGCLGPYYPKLNQDQQQEFIRVFVELLTEEYMDDIDRFRGTERVEVLGATGNHELSVVKTILITYSRERIPINYYLSLSGNSWRIHDFSVEGISLVNHYRELFSRFLVSHSFEELVQRLRQQLPKSMQGK